MWNQISQNLDNPTNRPEPSFLITSQLKFHLCLRNSISNWVHVKKLEFEMTLSQFSPWKDIVLIILQQKLSCSKSQPKLLKEGKLYRRKNHFVLFSDGSVNLFSLKIHAWKWFSAFHGIAFNFSLMSWVAIHARLT